MLGPCLPGAACPQHSNCLQWPSGPVALQQPGIATHPPCHWHWFACRRALLHAPTTLNRLLLLPTHVCQAPTQTHTALQN